MFKTYGFLGTALLRFQTERKKKRWQDTTELRGSNPFWSRSVSRKKSKSKSKSPAKKSSREKSVRGVQSEWLFSGIIPHWSICCTGSMHCLFGTNPGLSANYFGSTEHHSDQSFKFCRLFMHLCCWILCRKIKSRICPICCTGSMHCLFGTNPGLSTNYFGSTEHHSDQSFKFCRICLCIYAVGFCVAK